MTQSPNKLINETSPYLLQHAYNPVDWHPWSQQALDKAITEDKPIVLSIGYSACHWCHVMERESFEDNQIAETMNQHFVCIKLDREERPDLDQIYMEAIQSMGISGGWPLNIFLTPQQKPFYGGTYFPPTKWSQLLTNIAHAFQEHRSELEKSAEKFKESLNIGEVEKYNLQPTEDQHGILEKAIETLVSNFDSVNGGMNKEPKFPMPVIWNFVLHYSAPKSPKDLLDHLYLTLDKMAQGGIYDQIGGGFARYSVDDRWFAPHFEKMLYDNAQLISLYAKAFTQSKKDRYQEVVFQSIEFLKRELRDSTGAFYSALDADSEGVEGKFYVWEYHDFLEEVGDEGEFLVAFYGITPAGNWEQGQNILHLQKSLNDFAKEHDMDPTWLKNTLAEYQYKLRHKREQRTRPGLDDKIICGWNGLTIKALADAYAAFGEESFVQLASDCANFIETHMSDGEQLYRIYKKQGQQIPAFLEDYAAVISGYIALYQVTFNDKWLYRAQNLTSYAITNFYDHEKQFFYYVQQTEANLIARKKELFDNVIPASNSIMAENLWFLGALLSRNDYLDLSREMVNRVKRLIPNDPAYLSNWATVFSFHQLNFAEVVIGGTDFEPLRRRIAGHFHPHKVMAGSDKPGSLPLLEGRVNSEETKIHVCYQNTCQLPTTDPEEAISQLTY